MREGLFQDTDGNWVSLDEMCRREPAWAANRIRVLSATVARLMDTGAAGSGNQESPNRFPEPIDSNGDSES